MNYIKGAIPFIYLAYPSEGFLSFPSRFVVALGPIIFLSIRHPLKSYKGVGGGGGDNSKSHNITRIAQKNTSNSVATSPPGCLIAG
uniref:Uncharacterized protein n=1 Tax=Lactuca sativa TaxID=4236 RepID=A0A9R1VW25_LACSA|nr:hypothetical protein LSAT_V11C400176200 [Lactuca sativa]